MAVTRMDSSRNESIRAVRSKRKAHTEMVRMCSEEEQGRSGQEDVEVGSGRWED